MPNTYPKIDPKLSDEIKSARETIEFKAYSEFAKEISEQRQATVTQVTCGALAMAGALEKAFGKNQITMGITLGTFMFVGGWAIAIANTPKLFPEDEENVMKRRGEKIASKVDKIAEEKFGLKAGANSYSEEYKKEKVQIKTQQLT